MDIQDKIGEMPDNISDEFWEKTKKLLQNNIDRGDEFIASIQGEDPGFTEEEIKRIMKDLKKFRDRKRKIPAECQGCNLVRDNPGFIPKQGDYCKKCAIFHGVEPVGGGEDCELLFKKSETRISGYDHITKGMPFTLRFHDTGSTYTLNANKGKK